MGSGPWRNIFVNPSERTIPDFSSLEGGGRRRRKGDGRRRGEGEQKIEKKRIQPKI